VKGGDGGVHLVGVGRIQEGRKEGPWGSSGGSLGEKWEHAGDLKDGLFQGDTMDLRCGMGGK